MSRDIVHASIIGFGNIGRELYRTLQKQLDQFSVRSITNSSGTSYLHPPENEDSVDRNVAFMCVPTQNDGAIELAHTKRIFEESYATVVTCAKGMSAQHYQFVRDNGHRLGISATVGGGCGMVPFVRKIRQEYADRSPQELYGIVNATTNFMWNDMSEGRTQQETLVNAMVAGYSERGNFDFRAVLRGEINDGRLKSAILANEAHYPEHYTDPRDITFSENYEALIEKALEDPADVRFAIHIGGNKKAFPIEDKLFSYESRYFEIAGGFVPIHLLPRDLVLEGARNCLLARDAAGSVRKSNDVDGAGAAVTVGTMMSDVRKMFRLDPR